MFSLLTNRGSDFDAGDVVACYWDDVAEEIVVKLDETPPANLDEGDVVTSGPSLGSQGIDYNLFQTGFKFCDGTTLNYFGYGASTFPYAIQLYQANSIACQTVVVCDLEIEDSPIITEATDTVTNDGSIEVSATSTNGTIKVALTDFNYDTEGTALISGSHTFESLYAGSYTVYAKDASGCADTLDVIIPAADSYGLKYVIEWTDIDGKASGKDHKIEVLQKAYSGASSEVKAGDTPITYTLHTDNENMFHVVRASSLKFRIASITDEQYHELYTEDEREFLVKHYIDSVLNWTGYIIPFLYGEQYLAPPYYVDVEATDGLASLKELDFVDASENNFKGHQTGIKIISTILKKLNLNINIRSGLNMYEDSFASTATDDPLAQAWYDTTVYYDKDGIPESCDVVMRNILIDYGAVIAQADGYWVIYRPEELRAAFDYREFTPLGVYSSNGSINPILSLDVPVETSRLAWKDRSQHLYLNPSYGKFIITQKLIANPSLAPSYSFEIGDLVPVGFGEFFFKGWNIGINEGTGISWGFQEVNRGESKGCLFVNFPSDNAASITLYTIQPKMSWTSDDKIFFSFAFLVDSLYEREWFRVKFKLKIGSRYYNRIILNEPIWTTTDVGYNELYTSNVNSFEVLESTIQTILGTSGSDESVEIRLELDNHIYPDYGTPALFTAEATDNTITGRRRVVLSGDGNVYHFYKLRYGTEDTDSPNIERPDDFNISTNPKVWELTSTLDDLRYVSRVQIDDVVLKLLPFGEEIQSSITYEVVSNKNIKRTLEIDMFHGDCPTTITNARYAYKNYIKYNTLAEFVPTSAWARDEFPESNTIQTLLLKTVISQFRRSSRKLTGNLIGDIYLKPYTTLLEAGTDRQYMTQYFLQQARLNEYTVEIHQLKDAESGDVVTPFGGAFDPQAFGTSYD